MPTGMTAKKDTSKDIALQSQTQAMKNVTSGAYTDNTQYMRNSALLQDAERDKFQFQLIVLTVVLVWKPRKAVTGSPCGSNHGRTYRFVSLEIKPKHS